MTNKERFEKAEKEFMENKDRYRYAIEEIKKVMSEKRTNKNKLSIIEEIIIFFKI